jgi:hypothetical protein
LEAADAPAHLSPNLIVLRRFGPSI